MGKFSRSFFPRDKVPRVYFSPPTEAAKIKRVKIARAVFARKIFGTCASGENLLMASISRSPVFHATGGTTYVHHHNYITLS